MGTRYEDQPPEHWAGAESLDPTPVWKQYSLVALLLFAGLIAVLVVALLAIAPQIVGPPALVPGDRLVLAASDLPAVGAAPRRVGAPTIGEERAFWLVRPARNEAYAILVTWSRSVGSATVCSVAFAGASGRPEGKWFTAQCPDESVAWFDGRGRALDGGARDLDRYLVSVGDDRVIVNLSRLIRADEKVPAPSSP